MVDQEETPVQPKHRGHLPKAGKSYVFLGSPFFFLIFTYGRVLAPVVFKNPVVFDKKQFSKYLRLFLSDPSDLFLEHVVERFGMKEFPAILNTPRPHVSLFFIFL